MNRSRALGAPVLVLALAASFACQGIEPELRSLMQATDAQAGVQKFHVGPPVEVSAAGTARFARPLYDGFRPQRALELVTFIDRFYRAPANQGYDEVLARLDKELRAAGFDGADERLQVEFLKVADIEHAWTPVSAKLTLMVDGEEPRVLHAFRESGDVDRVMLPINAPSCDVKAEVALRLEDVKKGMVFVTSVPCSQVMARATNRGAAAVISASLYPFNEDSSGAGRQLDAIQFHSQPPGESMPSRESPSLESAASVVASPGMSPCCAESL